jgi:hypothetical protein
MGQKQIYQIRTFEGKAVESKGKLIAKHPDEDKDVEYFLSNLNRLLSEIKQQPPGPCTCHSDADGLHNEENE